MLESPDGHMATPLVQDDGAPPAPVSPGGNPAGAPPTPLPDTPLPTGTRPETPAGPPPDGRNAGTATRPVRDAEDGSATGLLPGLGTPVDRATDRRHGRRALWISVAALLVVAAIAWPVAGHLMRSGPVRVQTPDSLAGLTRDRDADAAATAEYLRGAVAAGVALDDSVGAVYTDGRGDAHSVIFIGGSSGKGSDESRLAALFGLLDDGTTGFTQVTNVPAGKLGGLVRCALSTDPPTAGQRSGASTDADQFAVCGWADATTVGIALFPNRTVGQAAALFTRMRPALLGQN